MLNVLILGAGGQIARMATDLYEPKTIRYNASIILNF
ncbi:hypothetical protein DTO96_100604 [Ephemeroptericola cinctiostellae]|uniref:Uncharacterized protein n=1 Tax=Ephemeroptericola cinctiostellae TaxID=2268024 RepID=A0A345D955_9BURK|nr:hypothetical protein DTO96_100604 [Ephemeroptericola cinctiostellae]